ncbi:hypothetical protein [Noviherbaspirillum sp. Root189]|uniref:hypothetical protein n=1 Tax=Noviherbaspirillum sp. Root189 TaxID=1736487 RepID=UPI00070FB113|nr:hypothetical protein [Noviherbaspirillum sp. Root189]KRB76831.1 hypothetical protein ASE07_26375 [Noviherbaspirillum sp. Root189]
MGTEYRIIVPASGHEVLDGRAIRNLKSFWKYDDLYGNYYLGKIEGSDWPELFIWFKDHSIGVTVNGGDGPGWTEFRDFVKAIKVQLGDLQIVSWDSGEDLSNEFLNN